MFDVSCLGNHSSQVVWVSVFEIKIEEDLEEDLEEEEEEEEDEESK